MESFSKCSPTTKVLWLSYHKLSSWNIQELNNLLTMPPLVMAPAGFELSQATPHPWHHPPHTTATLQGCSLSGTRNLNWGKGLSVRREHEIWRSSHAIREGRFVQLCSERCKTRSQGHCRTPLLWWRKAPLKGFKQIHNMHFPWFYTCATGFQVFDLFLISYFLILSAKNFIKDFFSP